MPLEIVLDASKTHKRGKRMQAAHRFFDHTANRTVFGHQFVVACLRFRGVTLPWEIKLYRPETYCKHRWRGQWKRYFHTFIQLAAEILEALPPAFTHEKATTVLFDSAFLNRVVLRACRKQNLRFLSVAKSNRIFFPAHGKGRPSKGKPSKQRIVGAYGPGLVRNIGRIIELSGHRGPQRFRVAERVGHLSKVGTVKLVFSQRLKDGAFLTLATDILELTATSVVEQYQHRWSIECWFKTAKQHLGLGDYQVIPETGVEHHHHLSALAYLLLIHLGLRRSGEVTSPRRKDVALGSVLAFKALLRNELACDHLTKITRKFGSHPALQAVSERMQLGTIPVT